MNKLSKYWREFLSMKLSRILFWLFLISLPFNTRIIYRPLSAYVQGYFSYYLATFLYISDLVLIAAFIALVVENRRNLAMFKPRTSKFVVLAGLGIILSAIFGLFHVQLAFIWKFYNILKLLEFGILMFVLKQSIQTNKDLRFTGLLLYASGTAQALLGIWQFHVQHGVGFKLLGEYVAPISTGGLAMLNTQGGQVLRPYGTFPHPNILAAFLLVALVWGYYFVSHETQAKKRIFYEALNFILLIALFLTFSRVAWLAAAIMTISFIVYTFLRVDPKRAGTVVFIGLVSCATVYGSWPNLLFTRISNVKQSTSYTERANYNHVALSLFKSSPILGTGLGNYIPTFVATYPEYQPWEYQPPHNIFIYIAASLGVLGLFGFVLLLYYVLRSTWNIFLTDLGFTLQILCFSLLFISLFDHFLVTIQQGQLLFFTSLGLLTSYKHLHNHNDKPQKTNS